MNKQSSDPDPSQGPASLARPTKRFTIQASPLNAVKLDLALIVLGAPALWLMLELASVESLRLVAVLAVYSVCGSLWIMLRARRVLRAHARADRS